MAEILNLNKNCAQTSEFNLIIDHSGFIYYNMANIFTKLSNYTLIAFKNIQLNISTYRILIGKQAVVGECIRAYVAINCLIYGNTTNINRIFIMK